MTDDKLIEKITTFLSKELFHNMKDVAIFKNDDGTYEFFNRYNITESKDGYVVQLKYNSVTKNFSSLKNAVTWCIFENRNKFDRASRIEHLDRMLGGTELSIDLHKRLIKKASTVESKLIYLAKLSEEQIQRKNMLKEMAFYISESKQWQTQKFATK